MPRPRVFKSLRVRLLAWYAFTFTAIVITLGATLYYVQRKAVYDQIDAALRRRAHALAAALRPQDAAGQTFDLELSDDLVADFDQPDGPSYAIWNAAGKLVDQSDPGNDTPRPPRPGLHTDPTRRRIAVEGPANSLILVGQHVAPQHRRLAELLWMVTALGAAAVLISLAGGWFLAGRALRPIRRITHAAQSVSASNLSQRIDVARTEDELGALVRTLNDAFDRLERAFEQQARFTADASHELRTPLSLLISQAQLTLKRDRPPDEYRQALQTSLAAAQRMRNTVEGLLKLARADAGPAQIARQPVSLASVIDQTANTLRPLAEQHRVDLTTHLPGDDPTLTGDPALLAELVANLLTNAIRYNRPGGNVTARLTHPDPDHLRLTVTDTGIGIPQADQPHVFERFYRVDRARSRDHAQTSGPSGSGLGLAIAKWITTAHQGTITLSSTQNEGTTVTVTLPRTSPSPVLGREPALSLPKGPG